MARKSTKGVAAPALNPGEQIKAARLAKGWSQAELGAKLGGITRARVQQIESWAERSRPSVEWFLEHGEVWAELGLGPELVVSLFGQPSVCPCCKRPF